MQKVEVLTVSNVDIIGEVRKMQYLWQPFHKGTLSRGPHRCPDKDICGGLKPRSDCPTNW